MDMDEIRRALEDKGADRDCEACGENDWGDVVPGLCRLGLESFGYRTMGVAVAVCNNCGLLRIHEWRTLTGQDAPEIPTNPHEDEPPS